MPQKKQRRAKGDVPLEKYRLKRDFEKTPEPGGESVLKDGHSFVIQEHHARSHHYDFRLEMDGVLVSWAVPKGIPENFSDKRLAVHVEDHPLEYGEFEGTIPKGNYGAGKVSIWDRGTWLPKGKNWKKEFSKGKLKFSLQGEKLIGGFILIRMGEEPNWLLRKIDEDEDRAASDTPEEEAEFVAPQLARPVASVPSGDQWVHELKFDGYRLIAVRRSNNVRLYTRNQLDWTHRFERLAEAITKLPGKDLVLDGEAVVFDKKGRSSFGMLQESLQQGKGEGVCFVVFDILNHDGRNLRALPLSQRMEKLASIVKSEKGIIRRSKAWPSREGTELFKQACKNGLEGIISKKANGRYGPGSRKDWVKSKCRARQEFLICGYTEPKGSLEGFGAILLGSIENGKLLPRGKVGTGFTEKGRLQLLKKFQSMRVKKPHFRMNGVTWLKPHLVAEIEFAEITRDGSIRHGSFLGLREDKEAKDIHIDAVQKTSSSSKILIAGIQVSHPDRIVYPDDDITKVELIRYFERVSKWMLPYVKNRPLAVLRAPGGIGEDSFFQKSFPNHVPDHVVTRKLDDGTEIFTVRDIKGIVSLAQFGVMEIHPWGSTLPHVDKPDVIIWDLDPHESVPWKEVQGAAFLLRDILAEQGLKTVVKVSGGKGIHILLPICRTHEWDTVKEFAKNVAATAEAMNPRKFLIKASKTKRKGRIYIDWLRNARGATCVAPWSPRARKGAAISMPINWSELKDAVADGFTIREAFSPPSDWMNIKAVTLKKKVIEHFSSQRLTD